MFSSLRKDLRAVMERDPAIKSQLEVVLCYPGFHAVQVHRLAHALYRRGWFVPARVLSQFTRLITGIEIHPGASLGEGLFIDHGAGVVIGETAVVGNNVTIYQGVTLGGTGKEKGKRHPTIGDNVVISAGAKVLGAFIVGDNSKIGAGSVVLKEVPPDSTVVGVPGRVVAQNGRRVSPGFPRGTDVDLRHDLLPDPVAEMLYSLQAKIERLEKRTRTLENENNSVFDLSLEKNNTARPAILQG